jgi:hypothetical protein
MQANDENISGHLMSHGQGCHMEVEVIVVALHHIESLTLSQNHLQCTCSATNCQNQYRDSIESMIDFTQGPTCIIKP